MKIYSRKPNKVGGGSKTNENGLGFEGRTSLIDSLNQNNEISIISNYKVFYKSRFIGYYCEKHNFYKLFLEEKNISWKKLITLAYSKSSFPSINGIPFCFPNFSALSTDNAE